MKLDDYIKASEHEGNKAKFSRAEGVGPQTVSKWVKNDYRVYDGWIVKRMRKIKAQGK